MVDHTVTTLIVSPGDSPFLERTLAGVSNQSLKANRIVVIGVGNAVLSSPEGMELMQVGNAKSFGDAIRRAITTDPSILDSDWLWLLHDDSTPHRAALENLMAAGSAGVTIGIVGPKQVAWSDSSRLLEVGIRASRAGRRMEYVLPGEIDQGQHDAKSDVLGVGTAGMLIRSAVWEATDGPDPVLGPFGDGLELSRRVRQLGWRTVVAPAAKISHARASFRDVRDGDPADANRSFGERRGAQIYNAMLANPTGLFVAMTLVLPFWTLGRMLVRLFAKQLDLVVSEFIGMGYAYKNLPHAIRARKQIHAERQIPASALASLEVRNRDINRSKRTLARCERESKPAEVIEPVAARLLRAHKVKSRVVGLVGAALALILTIFAGRGLAAGITGAAWVNLPTSYPTLWHEAWAGWVLGGAGAPGPAEPLLMVWALLAAPFALFGVAPSTVLVWFWLAAPVLAWAAMYWAADALIHRSLWRFAFATLWLVTPSFMASWSTGRMAGVMTHVALPLLLLGTMRMLHFAKPLRIRGAVRKELAVEDRTLAVSFGALAAASLTVIVASAPWTGLALVLMAIVLIASSPKRWKYTVVAGLPALALMLPTWITAVSYGGTRALRFLLADSAYPLAFSAAPTWQTILGLPEDVAATPQMFEGAHWVWLVPGAFTLLAATLALFNMGHTWLRTRFVYVVAVVAFVIAVVGSRTVIAYDGTLVAAWPGVALSIAQICLIVAWAGLLAPLVLEERLYSYRSRRKLDKAEKRRQKAAANRVHTASAAKHRESVEVESDEGGSDASSNAVTTGAEGSEADTTPSTPDIGADAPVEAEADATTPESQTEAESGTSDSEDDAEAATEPERDVKPHSKANHPTTAERIERRNRHTKTSERILHPLGALGLAAALILGVVTAVAWAPLAASDADREVAGHISPALTNETPAAAQYAQDYPRRARFLQLSITDEGVSASLHRGNGRELGDSSARMRLDHAIEMQRADVDTFDALLTNDPASADFARTIAELLNNTGSEGLSHFAIDQIAQSGEGPAASAAQTALDSNPQLERAGESDIGTLWRARPDGIEPSRIHIDDSGTLTPVPSGIIGASVDLSEYDFQPGALLVLSERADSGWHATIGAEALPRANAGWQQAFRLDQTMGVVKIAYHSEWMPLWWVLSAVSIVGMVIAGIPVRRRTRQDEA